VLSTMPENPDAEGHTSAGPGVSGVLLRLACNWRQIDDGVALAGQGLRPSVRVLLQHERVRAIINLRGANAAKAWYRAEVADCAELGIAHHDVRLSSRRLPHRKTLLMLLDAFDTLERPLLIKCAGGVDRSAFAAALLRLHRRGAGGIVQVRRDLQRPRLRHLYRPEQRWIRAFPEFYEETRGRLSFRDWIGDIYTARAFEDHLLMRGLAGAWRTGPLEPVLLEPAE